jgi:sulfur-oxidizing protein SoxY
MPNHCMQRRTFLKRTVAVGALASAATVGAWRPAQALVSAPPLDAFAAETEADVVQALFGSLSATSDRAVKIEAPLQVRDGQSASIRVSADLDDIEMIAVVTASNRHPLVTYVRVFGAVDSYRTRLKVEKTSRVTTYVKAAGRLRSASATVKVTAGGYGVNVI